MSIVALPQPKVKRRGLTKTTATNSTTEAIATRIASRREWALDNPDKAVEPDYWADSDAMLWDDEVLDFFKDDDGNIIVRLCNEKGEFLKKDQVITVYDPSRLIERIYTTNCWDEQVKAHCEALGPRVWQNSLAYYGKTEASAKFGNGLFLTEIDKQSNETKVKHYCLTTTPIMALSLLNDVDESVTYIKFSIYTTNDDNENVWQPYIIPLSDLVGQSFDDVIKTFADKYRLFFNDERNAKGYFLFKKYISDFKDKVQNKTLKAHTISGWHNVKMPNGEKKMLFMATGYQSTFVDNVHFIEDNETDPIASTAGDKDEYLAFYKKQLETNHTVLLLLGFITAGSLVRYTDVGRDFCPIVSVLGDSSIGKSLLLKFATALRTKPDLKTFDATMKGLSTYINSSNDLGAILDEIGAAGSINESNSLIYGWSSGIGRTRLQGARNAGGPKLNKTPRKYYTVLTSGEKSLKQEAANPGNIVRLTDLVFSENKPLWNAITCKAEADEIQAFMANNYGHLFPMIIKNIAANLQSYLEAYTHYGQMFDAELKTTQEKRKASVWALAMAGVFCLQDCLDLSNEAVTAAYDAAKTLVSENNELEDAINTTANFQAQLSSLPTLLQSKLIVVNINDEITVMPKAEIIGKYIYQITAPNVETHTLHLVSAHIKKTLKELGIDETRFKQHFIEEKIIKTNVEGHTSLPVRMIKGHGVTTCVTFIWKTEIEDKAPKPTPKTVAKSDLVFETKKS